MSSSGVRYDFKSEGINPFFHTPDTVAKTLRATSFEPFSHADVDEVYFYSAGTSNTHNQRIMQEGFRQVFPKAHLELMHDLLGAARALFQHDNGIACILGTGSNSCLYIDDKITMNLGGHGYILGDEGSGMHIGRKVLRDFMSDLMPEDIKELFDKEFGLSKDEISFSVYKKTFPNRYLASFSVFVQKYVDHPYFAALVDDAFSKFLDRYILQYPDYTDYPIRVLGSIGYYFEPELNKCAAERDLSIDHIIKSPIEGLLKFHSDGL